MSEIYSDFADEALWEAARALIFGGVKEGSRNGTVLRHPIPVTFLHCHPERCVVFDPDRDANPFFHLLEAIWMLSGSNKVEFLSNIVPRMVSFSDDGETFHGAYGHRWANYFGDQLEDILRLLTSEPNTRRAVLGIWDPIGDLGTNSRDLPCNTTVYFQQSCRDGSLDMTVCNRSNDLVWGALGANVVHFAFLHAYIAANVNMAIGRYYQFTTNLHCYEQHFELLHKLDEKSDKGFRKELQPYTGRKPLLSEPLIIKSFKDPGFRKKCLAVVEGSQERMQNPLLDFVAIPMWKALQLHKAKDHQAAWKIVNEELPGNIDFTEAAKLWLKRRKGYETV